MLMTLVTLIYPSIDIHDGIFLHLTEYEYLEMHI